MFNRPLRDACLHFYSISDRSRWWAYGCRVNVSLSFDPEVFCDTNIYLFSGELHDFLSEDLKSWYPELASRVKLTLVEALPSVLPMFSKQLIDYTESTFKESNIEVWTKTMVKEVRPDNKVVLAVKGPDGKEQLREVPFGVLVWAAVSLSELQGHT